MPPVRPTDPLPDWNPPDNQVESPSVGRRAMGWLFEDVVPSKWLNSLMRSTGRCIAYLMSQAYIAPADGQPGIYAEGLTVGPGAFFKGGTVGGRGVQGLGGGVGGSGGHFNGAPATSSSTGGAPGGFGQGTGERAGFEGTNTPGHTGPGGRFYSQSSAPAVDVGAGDILLSGPEPLVTQWKANTITKMNVPKAICTLVTGPSAGISDGYNMSTLVNFSTSIRVAFGTDFINDNFIVVSGPALIGGGGASADLEEYLRSQFWFEFKVRDRVTGSYLNLATQNFRVQLVFFGRQ